MSEKVKVKREIAKNLDRVISNFEGDKAFIIANYVKAGCRLFWKDDFNVMRELSDDALFKALYVGYEIEETPEEKLLVKFDWVRDEYKKAWDKGDDYNISKMQGMYDGIKVALETLSIKIKGINE